ncbi:polysaccharide pyruvyl transferase family protein [Gorillibacterium massiliense]|uniref:polysaccharide pyruvyl transferase family protein n=1 Tax=Gorillibacterium massiliense TaxID=1280390 RepID=UPI0004BB6DB2|nr:polysaccharide pyruvyl transferase family protein [Gorillibacterium massiliense]
MEGLKRRLDGILQAIPPGSSIYYVDYPVYNNGGDLLIMKGAEAFFRDHHIQVQARYSALNFPDKLSIPKGTIIVLQGGGNFGDLYPVHQMLREKIVADYTGHRIVILPQTIFYRKESELNYTASIFNRHPDVHLFVRDTLSYELASERFHSCHIRLSPDMAHQLWPIKPMARPQKDLLLFLRTDIEKAGGEGCAEEPNNRAGGGDFLDWATLYNRLERKGINVIGRLMKKGSATALLDAIWGKYSDYLVNKAIRRFSGYRSVETSRLHGHILSCLLDKPNTLLDNSYGKNSGYFHTWTRGVESARLVSESVPPQLESQRSV